MGSAFQFHYIDITGSGEEVDSCLYKGYLHKATLFGMCIWLTDSISP